jgi:hypothetical protein
MYTSRAFSDELDERILAVIQQEFWIDVRKISHPTFRQFVKRFWVMHRREALQGALNRF